MYIGFLMRSMSIRQYADVKEFGPTIVDFGVCAKMLIGGKRFCTTRMLALVWLRTRWAMYGGYMTAQLIMLSI